MFMMTMMSGTIVSISALSWLSAWIGLEINMLSLMPLMKNFNNKMSAESTIKYFIIQTMASMILLFSMLSFSNSTMFNLEMINFYSFFMNLALFTKMGAAPFHFWLPEVVSGVSWQMIFIILTWQKITPMILLMYSYSMNMLMMMVIILSSLIGGLTGLNQTDLKKIMAYSSINHISWMLAALMISSSTWIMYFLVYTMINFMLISHLYMNKLNYLFQLSKIFAKNKINKLIFMINFLSLGGLPPFLGFLPKWLTIFNLSINSMFYMSTILIIFTLMSLYMYIRIMFTSTTLLNSESIKLSTYNKTYFILTLSMNISISFLMILLSLPLF
uniref:NADH-ubiquinone oxidoreductase chain 2 n=1 Tax=Scolytinae sp. BMNH 1043133 TaxID=1903798 RepID=A0A343A4T7_9CUCU|nr:NADH dehydrogenase subunit 2 [Scolytinae sp. BMNH 1043133]